MMKKLQKLLVLGMCLTVGACALAACGDGKKDDGGITVSFVDGSTTITTVKVESGQTVDMPTAPTKTGYEFVRWYATPSLTIPFDFTEQITKSTSVFAGFRSTAPDDNTWYIAGTSTMSNLFEGASWKAFTGDDAANLPDRLAFERDAEKGNKYTLTADFYVGDQFQILNTVNGWGTSTDHTNQIGYGYIVPEQYSAETTANFYGTASVYNDAMDYANTTVGVAGNYTLTLVVDADGKLTEWGWERNGDAAELEVTYDLFIKGAAVTGWADMLVPYHKFTPDSAKEVYTLTTGMQADDQFMFAGYQVGNAEETLYFNGATVALATDEKTTAAIEKQAGGANFVVAGGTGTYEFTITFDENNAMTLSAEKTADAVPAYDFYVKGSIGGDSTWAERHAMTLNAETGMYEFTTAIAANEEFIVSAVAPGTDAADAANEKFPLNTAYANARAMSESIAVSGNNYKATAADTFTVSVNPISMAVSIVGENDAITYAVHLHGAFGGDTCWADGATVKFEDGTLTGTVTKELAVGNTFGIRSFRWSNDANAGSQISWVNAASAGKWTGCAGLAGDENITVETAGTYSFAVTINESGEIVAVVATAAAA